MIYKHYVQKISFKYHSAKYATMTETTFTNIRLRTGTRDRLKARGFKGEDYDTVIVRLLDATEKQVIETQGNAEGLPAYS